jgi:hypothetical protein
LKLIKFFFYYILYCKNIKKDQSEYQINNIREKKNYNRNEIFNVSLNIKKNISFDNKIKEKNKNIFINLQKEYYANILIFSPNDKNFSNHTVLNKTPEQK